MWSAWQDEARGGQCAVAGGESSLGGADRECAVEVDVTRGGVGVSVVKLNARMATPSGEEFGIVVGSVVAHESAVVVVTPRDLPRESEGAVVVLEGNCNGRAAVVVE